MKALKKIQKEERKLSLSLINIIGQKKVFFYIEILEKDSLK